MGKHHHHPHEGHSPGNAPGTGRRKQGPFFYLAGLAILIGLICFIIWGSFAGSRTVTPAAAPAPAAVAR